MFCFGAFDKVDLVILAANFLGELVCSIQRWVNSSARR